MTMSRRVRREGPCLCQKDGARFRAAFGAVILAYLLSGACSCAPKPAGPDQGPASGLSVSRYEGRIPCPDCKAIQVSLRLGPADRFVLKQIYIDPVGLEARREVAAGRWGLLPDGSVLTLEGGGERFQRLAIKPDGSLRMMNDRGEEIVYDPAFRLLPQHDADLPDEPAPLRGMFVYMADAAMFTECATGQSYPVAMEGGYIDLERAYLQARPGPGDPVLVTMEGRFGYRPKMEGEGEALMLLVDHFDGVWPEESCETGPGASP